MNATKPYPAAPDSKPRWYRLTPDRCLGALLAVEGLLWLSERFGWLPWHKGYAVMAAVAIVAAALMGMTLWFAAALLFRLRFQFSLRSLLLLVVLVAAISSWLAVKMIQREAVERVAAIGGHIDYDYDYNYAQQHAFDDNGMFDPPEPPGPRRLRKLLGDDLFNALASYQVVSVDLQRYAVGEKGPFVQADVSDDDMHLLRHLSMLRCLNLEFQPITDSGIKHLGSLKDLQHVDLYGTQISDESVRTLLELPNLERLNVGRTRINVPTLTRLLGKTKLNTLELSGDQIDGVGGWEQVKLLFPKVQVAHVEYTKGGGVSLETR